MVKKAKIYSCNNCFHEWSSSLKDGPKLCPKCKNDDIQESSSTPEKLKRERKEKDRSINVREGNLTNDGYRVPVGTTQITLSARDLSLSERLIQNGVARNMTDLTRKAIDLVAAQYDIGGDKMIEKEKKTAMDTLDEIQSRDLIDAYTKKISGGENISEDSLDKLEKNMEKQMRLTMIQANMKRLSGADGVSSSPLEQMLAMEMLKQLKGGDNNGNNVVIKRLEEMDRRIQQMNEDKKIDEVKNMVLELAKTKGQPEVDTMTKLAEILGKKDNASEALRMEIEKVRQELLNQKLTTLESKIGSSSGNNLEELKKAIQTAKEISGEFNPKKDDKGELTSKLISDTIDKIRDPILAPLGEAMADKIRNQQYQPEKPENPSYQPEKPENPSYQPNPIENYNDENYDDLINVSTQ